MTITLETRSVLACRCVWCNYKWDAIKKPLRCPGCKRRSWNGEDNRRRDPLENVPPGSRIANDKTPPKVRPRELLDVLMLSRVIIEQLIADCGPCDHAKDVCYCHEQSVAERVAKQIDALKGFTQMGT